jgi:hypothetical protein
MTVQSDFEEREAVVSFIDANDLQAIAAAMNGPQIHNISYFFLRALMIDREDVLEYLITLMNDESALVSLFDASTVGAYRFVAQIINNFAVDTSGLDPDEVRELVAVYDIDRERFTHDVSFLDQDEEDFMNSIRVLESFIHQE